MINTITGGEPERGAPCAFISFSNSNYANKEIRVVRESDSKTIFYTYADVNGNAYLPVFKKGNYKVFDTDKDLFPGLEYRINTNGKVYADSDRYSNKEEKEAIKAKAFSNIALDDWDTVSNLLYVANEPLDPVTETKWKVGDKIHLVNDFDCTIVKLGDSYTRTDGKGKAKLILCTNKEYDNGNSIESVLPDKFKAILPKIQQRHVEFEAYRDSYNVYYDFDISTAQDVPQDTADSRNRVCRIKTETVHGPFHPSILDIGTNHAFSNRYGCVKLYTGSNAWFWFAYTVFLLIDPEINVSRESKELLKHFHPDDMTAEEASKLKDLMHNHNRYTSYVFQNNTSDPIDSKGIFRFGANGSDLNYEQQQLQNPINLPIASLVQNGTISLRDTGYEDGTTYNVNHFYYITSSTTSGKFDLNDSSRSVSGIYLMAI